MFTPLSAFSGFSVTNTVAAQEFYTKTLGLTTKDTGMGLEIQLPGNGPVFAYPKANHEPASFTILNFEVEDIDAAVDELTSRGVIFERYEGLHQDEKGIARGLSVNMGPNIAWFKDPAGNILSVLQSQ